MLLTFLPAGADFSACVADYGSITETLNAIPQDAGRVTIRLWRSIFEEQDGSLEIPADRGITEIRFEPDEYIPRVALPDLYRICANGIPLTIGEGLVFENASIYGGACVSEGETKLDRSSVTIEGQVAFAFGGGLAENGARSTVTEPSLTVAENGIVFFEAFGGGHAYGSGSRVFSDKTNVLIDGTADYALGGGFAEEGGQSSCENAFVHVSENAKVAVALFTGGSAAGGESRSWVESGKAVLAGRAVSAFSGDFAFGGGVTVLNADSRLEILGSGSSDSVYMGSFASDPGSDAFVNTSELMICGEVRDLFKRSQSSDGGEAKTLFTALFPCSVSE